MGLEPFHKPVWSVAVVLQHLCTVVSVRRILVQIVQALDDGLRGLVRVRLGHFLKGDLIDGRH